MLALRVHQPQWASGRDCSETLVTFDSVYASGRLYEKDEVIVILNPGSSLTELMIATGSHTNVWYDLWRGHERTATNGVLLLDCMPAVSFTVLLPGAVAGP
jgi:hypothetical protein